MKLRNQHGFTLVEALVTGLIAAIIAATVFMAFISFDRRSRESISFMKMQRQYENISEQIAHTARSARCILPTGTACADPVPVGAIVTVTDITMFDDSCIAIGRYRISGDTLYEGTTRFQAGGGAVALAAGSGFVLPGNRDGVELRFAVKTTDRDTTYNLSLRRDVFQCRQ